MISILMVGGTGREVIRSKGKFTGHKKWSLCKYSQTHRILLLTNTDQIHGKNIINTQLAVGSLVVWCPLFETLAVAAKQTKFLWGEKYRLWKYFMQLVHLHCFAAKALPTKFMAQRALLGSNLNWSLLCDSNVAARNGETVYNRYW